MNDEDQYLEDNTAPLIRSAFGPQARPDPLTRDRTWRLLADRFRPERTAAAFSDGAVALLAGVLALLAAWLVEQTLGASGPVDVSLSVILVALLLTLNLAWVPVAGIVIVKRKRYV